jgi:hypothetical protein
MRRCRKCGGLAEKRRRPGTDVARQQNFADEGKRVCGQPFLERIVFAFLTFLEGKENDCAQSEIKECRRAARKFE